MILAFLLGGMFQLFRLNDLFETRLPGINKFRSFAYKAVVVYLLFKIGFKGGQAIAVEPLFEIFSTALLAVIASVLWTLFLLIIFRKFSAFEKLTQVAIATHFGSVSVGTFIAALEFLSALGVEVTNSVVIWLAMMELPALFVGIFALKIKTQDLFLILLRDRMLWVLICTIILGGLFPDMLSISLTTLLFSVIFLPILAYFLFEMGTKAATSLNEVKGKHKELFLWGIGIPILGGLLGASVSQIIGYETGEAFMFSILMASASYVLIPISLKEILHSSSEIKTKKAQEAIAISMAISVGIALPFNILIGFEIYYLYIKFLAQFQ